MAAAATANVPHTPPTSLNPWKLDVVGILAILGERNIRLSANLITSTKLSYLPRLLPAPQGLLSISGDRMKKLPSDETISVCAVYSGNKGSSLPYFATLLHHDFLGGDAFVARKIEIRPKLHDYADLEIRRRFLGPINVITMVSCVWSAVLLFYALYMRDWPGFLAVLLMSLTASMVSGAHHWRPRLPSRKAPRREDTLPPGDVVIRSAKGSFLVINCPDAVARKLYFNQEDCVYTIDDKWSRIIGGAGGGILIIIAVILFSNCQWYVQWGSTIAYAVLNIAYWLATICPVSWTWDFDDFHLTPSAPVASANYTGALAATIKMVGDVKWVSLSQAAPLSVAWTQWCNRAQEALNTNNDAWFVDRSHDLTAPKDLSHFQGALTYYLENPPTSV